MSGWTTATYLAAGALAVAAGGTGYSIYSSEKQRSAQNTAQDQSKAAAEKQAKLAEEETNAANRKSANANVALARAQQAAKGGIGGTMLTGSSGVDTSSLSLGKTSLLGG